MSDFDDGYDSYYADRLWQRLPSVYRALDSDLPGESGPLEELIARIGAQIAVVRRSIDRLWANQSIETCDDWVIPYLGDLLATELVNDDPRGQRLEVAKTIHYRRRKGTLAVLEEIGRDVTGWQAHVVEAFRRLGRTRHALDPPVGPARAGAALPKPCPGSGTDEQGDPRELVQHEGLSGLLTGTLAGGLADLRSSHGAQLAGSPFDEYFHTADVRGGKGSAGWFGIPKLLVFLWRLRSFTVTGGTPVAVAGSPTQFVFDPTGRRVPLFLAPLGPEPDDWVDTWLPAREWQVPGPLSDSLAQALADPGTAPPRHPPYPGFAEAPPFSAVAGGSLPEPLPIAAMPESGEFALPAAPGGPFTVSYQYGFSAAIGAGPYDRTRETDAPSTIGIEHLVSGGTVLDAALAASAGASTVTIADSLTYTAVSDIDLRPTGTNLLIRAGDGLRGVVRLPAPAQGAAAPAWVFTGGGADSELTLDGLFISGGDLILRGGFAAVRITACTADPGTLDAGGDAYATSADGRALAPVRIWVEADPNAAADAPGTVAKLIIDHCVIGPVRTRNGGGVEQALISDSIIQDAAPASSTSTLRAADIQDPELLVRALASGDPLAVAVRAALQSSNQTAALDALRAYQGGPVSPDAQTAILAGLNAVIGGEINRALLEAAFPVALSPAALALSAGTLALARATVLGRTLGHRLSAADTILAGHAAVEDVQDGCVRFSAYEDGSTLPSRYASVALTPGDALFTSTEFGRPGYGQLLDTADRAVVATPQTAGSGTITTGAENGSEMGAFSSQLGPLKEQRLLTKYAEYMPLGLTPVVVHVT